MSRDAVINLTSVTTASLKDVLWHIIRQFYINYSLFSGFVLCGISFLSCVGSNSDKVTESLQ